MAIADLDLKIPLKAADAAAVSSVTDGGLTTKEAGTFVLKPFRSPKSKKLKATVAFVPRLSHFDIDNERSNTNEFRVRLPSLVNTPQTRHSLAHPGVLHALLDLNLHMGNPHVYSKHRNRGRTAQLTVRRHALTRRVDVGAQ